MNTVWILIAIAHTGHIYSSVIPTLEFSTEKKCVAPIKAFQEEAVDRQGTVRMRCVRIEK